MGVVISAKLPDSSTFRRWVLSRGDRRGDSWWRKLDRTISLKPAVRSCTNKQTNLIIRRRCVKCGYFQNCCTSRRVQRGGTMLGMDRVLFVIWMLEMLTLSSTPWSSVLFEKLTVPHLVKKLHCYGIIKFITVITAAPHPSQSWARWIQSTFPS